MGRRKLSEEEKAQRKADRDIKKNKLEVKPFKKSGRPSLYSEEMQARAEAYLNGEWKSQEYSSFPSHIGLHFYLGVASSTLYEWAKVHPKFSETLEQINLKQQQISIHMGLTNQYNATIVKLVLSTHGIHERSETAHLGKDGGAVKIEHVNNLSDNDLNKIIKNGLSST